MKCSVKRNPTITLELNEHEAMVLAKILGNIGGAHEWRAFTGQLYAELLNHLDIDDLYEFGPGVIKQPMTLGE